MFRILRKILFPFARRWPQLATHWWHRLVVVLFGTFVVVSPFGIWLWAQIGEVKSYTTCVAAFSDEICEWGYYVFPKANIIGALVVTLLISYFLQFIYYKLIMFVVYGKPK